MGAFCTRFCPFRSPSSSFTSKSLQSWTRNASRNASESGWKRSNRRSRKTPVHQREPRVAAVSGFPGTAGRVPAGNPKPDVAPPCGRTRNSTEAQRSGFGRKRKCGGMDETCRLRQMREIAENGQNRGILDAAARKRRESRTKPRGSCAPRGGHICPRCGQFRGFTRAFQTQRKTAGGRCGMKKARRFKGNRGVPTKNTR